MKLDTYVENGESFYNIYVNLEQDEDTQNIAEISVEKSVIKDIIGGSVIGGLL